MLRRAGRADGLRRPFRFTIQISHDFVPGSGIDVVVDHFKRDASRPAGNEVRFSVCETTPNNPFRVINDRAVPFPDCPIRCHRFTERLLAAGNRGRGRDRNRDRRRSGQRSPEECRLLDDWEPELNGRRRNRTGSIPIPTPTPRGTKIRRITNHWFQASLDRAPGAHVILPRSVFPDMPTGVCEDGAISFRISSAAWVVSIGVAHGSSAAYPARSRMRSPGAGWVESM